MTTMLERMLHERNNVLAQARAINDRAIEESRDLTAEELQSWDQHNARIDELDQRMETIHSQELRTRRAEEIRSEYESMVRPTNGAPEGREDDDPLMAEIRAFLRGERRAVDISPPEHEALSTADYRALVQGTPSAGGYTVPTTFVRELLVHMIEMSGVLAAGATVFETDSIENIDWPKATGLSSASQTAEATQIATSNPTFGKLTLGGWKYPVLVDASKELVDATAVDILSFIAQESGWAVGNALGAKLVTGAGTTEPSGIVTGSTLGKTGAAAVAGVPTFDNLIDLEYSVIAPYRNRPTCGWLFRDATAGFLRKLKDGEDHYIWQPSAQLGQPDRLNGYPVKTDPNVPALAADAKSILFGDMSRYFVRRKRGVRFERSDDFQFDADVITFKTVIYGDGGVADTTGAIKHFKGGAAS